MKDLKARYTLLCEELEQCRRLQSIVYANEGSEKAQEIYFDLIAPIKKEIHEIENKIKKWEDK